MSTSASQIFSGQLLACARRQAGWFIVTLMLSLQELRMKEHGEDQYSDGSEGHPLTGHTGKTVQGRAVSFLPPPAVHAVGHHIAPALYARSTATNSAAGYPSRPSAGARHRGRCVQRLRSRGTQPRYAARLRRAALGRYTIPTLDYAHALDTAPARTEDTTRTIGRPRSGVPCRSHRLRCLLAPPTIPLRLSPPPLHGVRRTLWYHTQHLPHAQRAPNPFVLVSTAIVKSVRKQQCTLRWYGWVTPARARAARRGRENDVLGRRRDRRVDMKGSRRRVMRSPSPSLLLIGPVVSSRASGGGGHTCYPRGWRLVARERQVSFLIGMEMRPRPRRQQDDKGGTTQRGCDDADKPWYGAGGGRSAGCG
ncbi:hypothetical protein C8J57DRAFT_1252280 [Mycena rebaudengoi]|nr:hypothetical protein C8J57DRAFT_1252280 [Mycena rebaudengoi]